MGAVLSLVVSAIVGSYMLMTATTLLTTFGMTWLGKTAVSWAAVAVIYDLTLNRTEGDTFTLVDAAVTGVGTLAFRGAL